MLEAGFLAQGDILPGAITIALAALPCYLLAAARGGRCRLPLAAWLILVAALAVVLDGAFAASGMLLLLLAAWLEAAVAAALLLQAARLALEIGYLEFLALLLPLWHAMTRLQRERVETAISLGAHWPQLHRRILLRHAARPLALGLLSALALWSLRPALPGWVAGLDNAFAVLLLDGLAFGLFEALPLALLGAAKMVLLVFAVLVWWNPAWLTAADIR